MSNSIEVSTHLAEKLIGLNLLFSKTAYHESSKDVC